MFSSYKSYTSFICLFLTVLGLCCWAWALCASIVEAHGLSCCTACGIFLTRDWSHVSCSGRWIPIHCTTREVLWLSFLSSPFLPVFSSVQFSHSVVSDSLRPQIAKNHSTPGLPVHHQLPEFTQSHVHWVGDTIQPSHPLSSPSPPAPNPSQHQGLFQWVNSSQEVAKVLGVSASASVLPMNTQKLPQMPNFCKYVQLIIWYASHRFWQ